MNLIGNLQGTRCERTGGRGGGRGGGGTRQKRTSREPSKITTFARRGKRTWTLRWRTLRQREAERRGALGERTRNAIKRTGKTIERQTYGALSKCTRPKLKTRVYLWVRIGQFLRTFAYLWIAMTCTHFGRHQICTQVDATFSPFGHPTQVSTSWATSNGCYSKHMSQRNTGDDERAQPWNAFGRLASALATHRKSLVKFNLRLYLRLLTSPFGQGRLAKT